jgi:hypothetical protein
LLVVLAIVLLFLGIRYLLEGFTPKSLYMTEFNETAKSPQPLVERVVSSAGPSPPNAAPRESMATVISEPEVPNDPYDHTEGEFPVEDSMRYPERSFGPGTINDQTEIQVNSGVANTLVLEFDKASYTPGEKGYIFISAKDAAGATIPNATLTNLMATGGITLAGSFSGTAPTLTDVTYATSVKVASVDGCESAGKAVNCLLFYAPYAGTSMKITATGGSLLPSSGRVAVSATASVADSGAAALAAVTALATTVASLKTLITTLTNLVLKIQKKVKA